MKKSLGLAVAGLAAAFALSACGSDVASDATSAAASAAAGVASSAAASAASQAASAASSAVAEVTGGACESLTSLQGSISEQTDPAATVGDVRAAVAQAQAQLDQVAAEAGPVQGALVTALQGAEGSLLDSLEGQPDDTPISEASPAVASAVQTVKSAYDSLVAALGC